MRHASMEGSAGGHGSLIEDPRLAAPKIGIEPSLDAGVEVCGGDFVEEGGDVDGVKRLGEVDSHHAGSPRRLLVVEAVDNSLGDGKESGCAGATGFEAVLRVVGGEVIVEEGEKEPFEDFGRRREKGYGAERRAFILGFAGLGKRDDNCFFPDRRHVGMGN